MSWPELALYGIVVAAIVFLVVDLFFNSGSAGLTPPAQGQGAAVPAHRISALPPGASGEASFVGEARSSPEWSGKTARVPARPTPSAALGGDEADAAEGAATGSPAAWPSRGAPR